MIAIVPVPSFGLEQQTLGLLNQIVVNLFVDPYGGICLAGMPP